MWLPVEDIFPPTYSSSAKEIQFDRCGQEENKLMEMYHNWYELASSMAPHRVVNDETKQHAWEDLCLHFIEKNDPPKDTGGQQF